MAASGREWSKCRISAKRDLELGKNLHLKWTKRTQVRESGKQITNINLTFFAGDLGDRNLGLTNIEDIQKIISNLKGKQLFEDPDFPASSSSLFYSKRPEGELKQFTWKRPFQLAKNPSIYVDGTSRKDVIQGLQFA